MCLSQWDEGRAKVAQVGVGTWRKAALHSTQKVAAGLGRVLKLATETGSWRYEPSSGEMTSALTNHLVVSRLKQTADERGSSLGNPALVGGQLSDIEICHVGWHRGLVPFRRMSAPPDPQ